MMYSRLAEQSIQAHANNYYGLRNQNIQGIVVHHMGGIMSGESCAKLFQIARRGACSNYCIGEDGDIVCSLYEEYASGCSSNKDIDNKCITIEVSNDNTNGWTVSNKAILSLILLLSDIQKRYSLGVLKENINVFKHCDFSATLCPGPYIKKHLTKILTLANMYNKPAKRIKGYWYRDFDKGSYYVKNDVSMWTSYDKTNRKKIINIPKGAKVKSFGCYNISEEGYKFHWVHFSYGFKTYKGYVSNHYLEKMCLGG